MNNDDLKHLNITISGRVQGVGFRASTRDKARSLDIKGSVKNRMDGTVYIEAEGEEGQLEEFVKWCKKGPLWASVDHMEIMESALKFYPGFDITR